MLAGFALCRGFLKIALFDEFSPAQLFLLAAGPEVERIHVCDLWFDHLTGLKPWL